MLASMGVQLEQSEHGAGHVVTLTPPPRCAGARSACRRTFPRPRSFIVAGCIGAPDGVLIKNVGVNPTRTGLLTILREMGADIELEAERKLGAEPVADLFVRQSELKGIDVDPALVALAIDEFPILFIAAAAARGTTRVTGAEELRKKETDRIAVMAQGLAAVGIAVEEQPGRPLDHRRPSSRRHRRQSRRPSHRDVVRRREPARARADRDPEHRRGRDFVPDLPRGPRVTSACGWRPGDAGAPSRS